MARSTAATRRAAAGCRASKGSTRLSRATRPPRASSRRSTVSPRSRSSASSGIAATPIPVRSAAARRRPPPRCAASVVFSRSAHPSLRLLRHGLAVALNALLLVLSSLPPLPPPPLLSSPPLSDRVESSRVVSRQSSRRTAREGREGERGHPLLAASPPRPSERPAPPLLSLCSVRSNKPRAGASQFAEFALSTGARFEGRGGAAEAREAATALPSRAGVVASCYTGRQLLLASWLLLDEAERRFAAAFYLQVMSLLSLSFLSLSLRFRCFSSLSLSFVPRVLFFFLYVSSSVSSSCVLTSPASSSASLPTPPIILAPSRESASPRHIIACRGGVPRRTRVVQRYRARGLTIAAPPRRAPPPPPGCAVLVAAHPLHGQPC